MVHVQDRSRLPSGIDGNLGNLGNLDSTRSPDVPSPQVDADDKEKLEFHIGEKVGHTVTPEHRKAAIAFCVKWLKV